MPDLGKVANVLGTAMLAGAGPSGRGVAGNLLNQQRAIAFKEKEMEADRLRQEQENMLNAGKQTLGLLVEGLKQTTDATQQQEILGAIRQITTANPNLMSPEGIKGIEALAGTGISGLKAASTVGKIEQDYRNGLMSESDYRAAINKATRVAPGVQVQVGGEFKIPSGYKMNPKRGLPNEPDIVPITGGPAEKRPPEQAAKLAMLAEAKENFPSIRSALINENEDGVDVNWTTIAAMNANIPKSDGRVARTRMRDAIEAKLRAETGAAAPDKEVDRMMDRFMPSLMDNDEGVVDKMSRFESFLDTALEFSDPELYKKLTKKNSSLNKSSGEFGDLSPDEAEELKKLREQQGG